MTISLHSRLRNRLHQMAYTMVEVLIGVAIMGSVFVSLYAGMTSGFAITQLARENLRATQIILERMEGVRLFNWNQLCYSNMIPLSFTNYYYPLAQVGESKGIVYKGDMVITNAELYPYATYGDNMRKVIVSVTWTNGGVARTRSMTTYQSRNGLQNYVYNN